MSTGAEALQTGSNTAAQFFPRDDQLKLDTEKIAGEALPEDFAGDPVVAFLLKKRQLTAQNILKKEYEAAAATSLQVKPETKPAPVVGEAAPSPAPPSLSPAPHPAPEPAPALPPPPEAVLPRPVGAK